MFKKMFVATWFSLSTAAALSETCLERASDITTPVSEAGCPVYGRERIDIEPMIQTVHTTIGDYELYVFRGRSTHAANGECTVDQPFTPFLPADIMFAANGDLYISGEFMNSFIKMPVTDYACTENCSGRKYKQEFCTSPPGEKPFALALPIFGPSPRQSDMSGWSVGGTTTPDGTIWISQPGAYAINGSSGMASKWSMVSAGGVNIPVQTTKNRGRLVAYNPDTNTTSIFNIPAPWPNPLSPAWDNQRQRLWFLDAGWDFHNPRVGSFNPAQLARGPGHESPQSSADLQNLADLECEPGQSIHSCYKFYNLPKSHDEPGLTWPGFLTLDPGGRVWISGTLSNNLARLTPETGVVDIIPLDDTAPTNDASPLSPKGHGPFYTAVDSKGFLWVGSYIYGRIFRIDTNRPSMADCKQLDANKRNPCLEEFDVAAAYKARFPQAPAHADYGVDGISFDHQENLWFGRGYISASDLSIHFIAPLREQDDAIYKVLGQRPFANKLNGDIWFADYLARKIYWLKKLPPSAGPSG